MLCLIKECGSFITGIIIIIYIKWKYGILLQYRTIFLHADNYLNSEVSKN